MGRARKFLALLRRSARDPGASVAVGAAIGATAGVLAVAVSSVWLILALAAPLGRRLIAHGASSTGGDLVDEGEFRTAPVEETVTETTSDRDWMAVDHGSADALLAHSAQESRTSRSGQPDVEGSYVEF